MHSILKPYKYNIPFHTEFLADPTRYEVEILSYLLNSNGKKNHKDLISKISNKKKLDLNAWATAIELLIKHSLRKAENGTHHHIKDRWNEYKSKFSNPYIYCYTDWLNLPVGCNDTKLFESKTFTALFLEVTRDNVTTDVELSFLEEKAREYSISRTDLDKALKEHNPALRTYSKYVIEACRDGKITSAEQEFLDEKASAYNLSDETKHEIINKHLNISKGLMEQANNPDFYELVVLCLLNTFVSGINRNTEIRYSPLNLFEDKCSADRSIATMLIEHKGLLIKSVESRLGHNLPDDLKAMPIADWVTALGFNYTEYQDAAAINGNREQLDDLRSDYILRDEEHARPNEEDPYHLHFNGFEYRFISSRHSKQLFSYQVSGSIIFVTTSAKPSTTSQNRAGTVFTY